MKKIIITLLLTTTFTVSAAPIIYPAGGQTAEQQKKDEAECHLWAIDTTGYDPANPPTVAAAPAPTKERGGIIKGAAKGALIGEIADGDTGDAALAGAAFGGLGQARRNNQAQQKAAAQPSVDTSGSADYNRARVACLEGRGYTVK